MYSNNFPDNLPYSLPDPMGYREYYETLEGYELEFDADDVQLFLILRIINEWEYDFYCSILVRTEDYTPKQINKIIEIENKINKIII